MKRSPLRNKRPTPRRKAPERVAYTRTSRKAGAAPDGPEKRHIERIAAMPCLVTGKTPVVVHHLMKCPGKQRRRDHRFVIPIIPELHNMRPESIHGLGSEEKFERVWSLAPGFLAAWAIQQWEESNVI